MSVPAAPPYDEPDAIAAVVAGRPRPVLVGLDVDGVLAPIVDRPADARLLEGITGAIAALCGLPGMRVAVVSGRSVADLGRFGFGPDVDVVGSHGLELPGADALELDGVERQRLAAVDALARDAAVLAGDGSVVETKPASVAFHVRLADAERSAEAMAWLRDASAGLDGVTTKPGADVLEIFARTADKGTALVALAARHQVATTVYVGDDVTDEDAFAQLGAGDVTVKVGGARTIATYRLVDPAAVLAWLRAIATRW